MTNTSSFESWHQPPRGGITARSQVAWIVTWISLVLACAGGAGGLGQPAWIEAPDAEYPKRRFLVGVGQGDSLDAAANRAKGAIAGIFESRVESEVEIVAGKVAAGGRSDEYEKLVSEVIVRSDVLLEGVTIEKKWRDLSGSHYALAVLDKAGARQTLSSQLNDLEESINSNLTRSAQSSVPLEKIHLLRPAQQVAGERDVLAARYRVVAGGAWQPAPGTATVDLFPCWATPCVIRESWWTHARWTRTRGESAQPRLCATPSPRR